MGEKKENKGVTGNSSDQSQLYYQQQQQQQQQYYGTFQGIPSYNQPPPQQSVLGFPQPAPPPGTTASALPYYYNQGYQAIPIYAVADGRILREPPLQCCGIGIGWFLFIAGFFMAGIPWYVGAMILLCVRVDYREKAGLVACMIGSVLAVIAIMFGVSQGTDAW